MGSTSTTSEAHESRIVTCISSIEQAGELARSTQHRSKDENDQKNRPDRNRENDFGSLRAFGVDFLHCAPHIATREWYLNRLRL